MDSSQLISPENFANIMGVSKATLQKWEANGTYIPDVTKGSHRFFSAQSLKHVEIVRHMLETRWDEEMMIRPLRPYTSIELFAGAGGLALGMEKAGFHHVLLNEQDHDACRTLLANRSDWHVVEAAKHSLTLVSKVASRIREGHSSLNLPEQCARYNLRSLWLRMFVVLLRMMGGGLWIQFVM